MLSFRQFLAEAADATPFPMFPNIEAMSLDTFVTSAPKQLQTEADGDEGGEFGLGAKVRPQTDTQMLDYLNRVFDREVTKKDKVTMPIVHRSLLQKVDGKSFLIKPGSDVAIDVAANDTIDVDALKRDIRTRPKDILTQNEKMAKSSGVSERYLNFGIPALTGLVVNEKTNEFAIISTCPGAGACQLFCFAMKGSYVQYVDTNRKLMRVLNFLMNDPKGFFKHISGEIAKAQKNSAKANQKLFVRWHDSGDFFSEQYKELFFELAKQFPDITFFAYSKLAHVVNDPNAPGNIVSNFSRGAKPEQQAKVDFKKTKHSSVVDKELFADLIQRVTKKDEKGKDIKAWDFSPENLKTLKQRIGEKYGIDPKTLLTYKEMKATPESGTHKWNVIVVPGDGDVSAARRDVLGTYLLIH